MGDLSCCLGGGIAVFPGRTECCLPTRRLCSRFGLSPLPADTAHTQSNVSPAAPADSISIRQDPAEARGIDERSRAETSWAAYKKFIADPGHKCASCWLMKRHCCCAGLPLNISLRPQIAVVMHHLELGRHLGSNTAKLLLHFGGELFAWGLEADDSRLQHRIEEDPAGTVVLFPSADAIKASELALRESAMLPRLIVVLDGGWRECKRMNEWINPQIQRCVVTTATREEFGGTRKYGGTKADANGRVQTAAAFIALLQELGEDRAHVAAVREGLAHFMACWEAQICRSKKWVS